MKKLSEQNAPRLCSPPNPPHGAELWGAESLQSHPHEGAPIRSSCNSFIFEAKKPHLLPCGSISFTLARSSLVKVFVPSFVSVLCCRKFTFFVSKVGKRVWALAVLDIFELEIVHSLKFLITIDVRRGYTGNAVLTSLNTAFLPISRSRFKQH